MAKKRKAKVEPPKPMTYFCPSLVPTILSQWTVGGAVMSNFSTALAESRDTGMPIERVDKDVSPK